MSNLDLFDDLERTGEKAQKLSHILQADLAEEQHQAAVGRMRPEDAHAALLTGLPPLNGEPTIILNFETTGLRWWDEDEIIGASYLFPASGRKGYIPLRHRQGENVPIAAFHAWLDDLVGLEWMNINLKFDLHMAEKEGWRHRDANVYADVAHDAALLDDNRARFNLDLLAEDFLAWHDDLGKLPPGIKDESEFRLLHPGIVAPYAVRNVEQVHRLNELFAPQIIEQELERVQRLERDIIPVVVEMERNGLYVDRELLERWHGEVLEKIEATTFEIYRETGIELTSFDAPSQTQALMRARGHVSQAKTRLGAESFGDAVMREFAAKDPIIATFLRGGQLADLHSKYLDKYRRTATSDGWLRFNLHQLRAQREEDGSGTGTVSGRFSAAGDREGGFNPQQVVAAEKQLERGWCSDYVVRRLFKAAPGYPYVIASDMAQIEYRLFADLAGKMGFEQATAPYHAEPLQKMIGGKPVWIQGREADFHAIVSEILNNPALNRKLVKNINFANLYGAGMAKFANMMGLITKAEWDEVSVTMSHIYPGSRITRHELTSHPDLDPDLRDRLGKAIQIRDTYDRAFPAAKTLLRKVSDTAEKRGYVKTLLGRRARLTGRYHSGLNRVIQGGAADVNKGVLVEAYKARKQTGFLMQCTVHDEVVGSGHEGVDKQLDKVLNAEYFPQVSVPILWETKAAATWADCK